MTNLLTSGNCWPPLNSLDLFAQVNLPSSTEVKVTAADYGLDVHLLAPPVDSGEARGLCGTFDGNPNNEFTHRDGHVDPMCHFCPRPDSFTDSWRYMAPPVTPQTTCVPYHPPSLSPNFFLHFTLLIISRHLFLSFSESLWLAVRVCVCVCSRFQTVIK